MGRFGARDVVVLIGCIALCEAVGLAGAYFTASRIPTWYAGLRKPSFNPPSWLFGPVWTLLYLLMAVALFLVLRRGLSTGLAVTGVVLFGVQLLLNFTWSYVFFGRESLLGGLAIIVALWLAIAANAAVFFRLSAAAGWLLVPYLAWVTFAGVLNAAVFQLNR